MKITNAKVKLHASLCNNKQRWNKDKCRCEWKELIHRGICNTGFLWKTSDCDCECDNKFDVGEYSD